MKNFKLIMHHDFAEGLEKMICDLMQMDWQMFDDKLIIAGLAEIKARLYQKLSKYQREYIISLTPVQAIALMLLVTTFGNVDLKSYMGNELLKISNNIHQQYQ